MEQNTKQINTTIDINLWKLAMMNDISWKNALETGIKAIASIDTQNNNLEKLKKEHTELIAKAHYLQEQITKLEVEKKKKAPKPFLITGQGDIL